jgi:putative redox protein
MTAEVKLKWTEGLQFVARAGDGPAVVMDSQDGASGPSPMQMVLMGVAGCTAMDVLSILNKKRVNLNGFQVNIAGERAPDHPMRYTQIHVEYVLYGRDIKTKDVERAIELSENKYCSAMASLCAKFENSYRIIESQE